MKNLISLLIVILLTLIVIAGSYAQGNKAAIAPAIKTFAVNPEPPTPSASTVNLMTGDVSMPLNLISLPGRNDLSAGFSVYYNSNVQSAVKSWNAEFPTSVVGLGWSIAIPKIVCDNKQTGSREDDEYFLVEGGYNKLVRTTQSGAGNGLYYGYETKDYLFWKIKFYPLIEKWEIIKEDGTRYIYGDNTSTHNAVQWIIRWDNWIGNSPEPSGQQKQGNVWNLAEIINIWDDKISYDYERAENYVGNATGDLKQTEASYLKKITDPLGRTIELFYADKEGISVQTPSPSNQEYIEPHTERAEPDAYQETYERKYLDRIVVNRENGGGLLFSVHFSYQFIQNGKMIKRLLTSVIQKNSAGNSLPGLSFSYYQPSGTYTNNIAGCLEKITYPTGGTVTYSYNSNGVAVGHGNRELVIYPPPSDTEAPNGYGEPKTWIAEDYVVVAWRGYKDVMPRSTKQHTDQLRPVRLKVYQWVGEWREQDCSFGSIGLIKTWLDQVESGKYDYQNFQVSIQKNFFAVLWNRTGNYHSLLIGYKREDIPGEWTTTSSELDYGVGTPTLMSGDNFVTVGSRYDGNDGSTYYVTRAFTQQGDSWKMDIFNQTCGDHFYAASTNFFLSYNRAVCGGTGQGKPEFNINVLGEDKKWRTKLIPFSSTFSTGNDIGIRATNSLACVIDGDRPQFVYRWSSDYNSFYKDDKNNANTSLFLDVTSTADILRGGYTVQNGGMISFGGLLTRFDGKKWYSVLADPSTFSFAVGNDFFFRTTQIAYTDPLYPKQKKYTGRVKYFDLYGRYWQDGPLITTSNFSENQICRAGIDYFIQGIDGYYRNPDGNWTSFSPFALTLINDLGPYVSGHSGYPRFEVGNFNNTSLAVLVKNGSGLSPYISFGNQVPNYRPVDYSSQGVSDRTIVLSPFDMDNTKNSPWLRLVRLVDDQFLGYQTDYPVTLITTGDGFQNTYISISYDLPSATMDPSGTGAYYNKVTVVKGSSVPPGGNGPQYLQSTIPYGYTETFFINGLPLSEMGGNPQQSFSLKCIGQPYLNRSFDKTGTLVAESRTTYRVYTKEIKNGDGTKVDLGYYVRPWIVYNKVDGIESQSLNYYDPNTGLVSDSYLENYDSKTRDYTLRTDYKYFWEVYDVNREKNILSPIISTSKSITWVGGTSTEADATVTTWKQWANGVYAPHKSYTWRRNGSRQFNFTQYSGNDTHPPASDWKKVMIIKSIDNKGNITEIESQ
jgi:hypothetical protein